MNKKLKIFIKVIYYIFTLGIGILLAFVLPGLLMTVDLPGHIEDYLNNGEFARSVNLLAGYDDKEIAYERVYDDGYGIVLFRTLVIIDNQEEDKKQNDNAYFAYSGFLYKLGGKYNTYKLQNNKTKLVVNHDEDYKSGKGTADGLKKNAEVELLGYDTNRDEMFDNVLTLVKYNYIYFEILEKRLSENINNITFIDAEGKVFLKVDGLNLDFSNVFYQRLKEFKDVYNTDSTDLRLVDLQKDFLSSSENYEKCSYQEETGIAAKKGAIIVLIYFICIYILADFLVGQRFIIRFVSFIIKKIRKKMGKEEEPKPVEEVYGTDYYTMLTVTLKVPEDCLVNMTIHYHNESDEINMIFTKDNNYTVTQRTHAGVYKNAWLEAPGYVSQNLPKFLSVRGFKMNVEVSMKKALENENNLVEEKENKKEE